MKAAVLKAQNLMEIETLKEPIPSAGEVVVRVRAAGVCGSDVPRVLSGSAHHYPIVLGHEFSGDIVAIGDEVTGLRLGARVAGVPLLPCGTCQNCLRGFYSQCGHYSFIGSRINGAFAEYVVLPVGNVVEIADNVSYVQGAFFEPSTVGLHGLFVAGFVGGGDVAVLGCGNIGLFTMMWAKIMGARSVTVFDIDKRRLDRAKEFGADYTVDLSEESGDSMANGFSDVFETAGTPETIRLAFVVAGTRAKVCCIGTPSKDFSFSWKQWELINRKEFALTASWMSYSAPFPGKEWHMTAACLADGRLLVDDRLIYKRIGLDDLPEAFNLYKQPGVVSGKIMVEMD